MSGAKVCDHGVPVAYWVKCQKCEVDAAVAQRTAEIVAFLRAEWCEKYLPRPIEDSEARLTIADAIEERYK